ncbi:uncharacterized protein LOC120079979 [Benincasa hispida]|uniref:uncharacterized protein LOC120079979 n=1 Tax=Benincasa hispida TaxID=102211 RepID=UPI0019008111|nr:uncharacterized protein LOC120079979 [Benincasa hispida]
MEDFILWTKRVKVFLNSQKVLKAFDGPQTLPTTISVEDRQNMEVISYRTLILNITGSVLRQVINENTTYEIKHSKSLNENLDEFKKLTNEFNQLGEKLGAKSKAAILINSLHDTFKEVKSALKYERESVTVNVVITALKSKELELQLEKNVREVESLYFKRKNQSKKNHSNKNEIIEDSNRNRDFRRDEPRRSKEHGRFQGPASEEAYKYIKVFVAKNKRAVDFETEERDWVLELGCTYRMTSKKS